MGRPGVTINATVLTAAIRVYARLEPDIGTVIAGNDRLRAVAVINRLSRARIFIDFIMRIFFKMERLEAVRWIDRSPPGVELPRVNGSRDGGKFSHVLPELFGVRGLSHSNMFI